MSEQAGHAVAVRSEGSLGPRRLTLIHAVGQALGIGPIFSVGAVSGLVAGVAGFNTPLSIVFGDIGALGIAYAISLYARRFAGAGAMYEYLARSVGNSFGVFSGGTYLCGVLMLGSGGIYLGLCFLVQGFFAAHLHANIPWWAGGLAGIVVAFTLNHFGVRLAVRGVLTMAACSTIPFLILSIVIIAKGGVGGNTWSVFDPGQTSVNSVFSGVLFAILLFVGFEAAASIAEEMHAPRRYIPVALILTVFLSAVLYLLVTYAATIGFGRAALLKNAWASSPDAMGTLAQTYVGSWLSVLIDLAIIFDALSLGIAIMVTSSRLLFALARDGLLPRWLSKTSRYNTPVSANVLLAGWGVIMLLWTVVTDYAPSGGANVIETFTIAADAGSFLVEIIYLFLAVYGLVLVWQAFPTWGARWWRLIVVLIGVAAPVLAFKGSLDPFPPEPIAQGVWIWLAGMALSLVWYLFLRARHPDRIARAAAYATEDAEAESAAAGGGAGSASALAQG
ncbi:MAG TPA: APC family permease [Solirubrobacteraceae bacterium]|nr:APC family permease [Solirubrobacteraceae bacterium]